MLVLFLKFRRFLFIFSEAMVSLIFSDGSRWLNLEKLADFFLRGFVSANPSPFSISSSSFYFVAIILG